MVEELSGRPRRGRKKPLTFFDCIVRIICTTNLAEKVDDAAFRRFTFKAVFDYLTPTQIELAFRRFFGQVAPTTALKISCLTPGDFAVVKKKVEYLGGADDSEIARMLAMETSVKPCRQNSHRLGFRTA